MKIKCIDNSCLDMKPFSNLKLGETYEIDEELDTFKVYHMLNWYEFYVIEGVGNFLKYRFTVLPE